MSIRLSSAVCVVSLLICASAACAAPSADDAYDSVDPFIGTGEGGHTYPGASLPFGMVQLSPDTDVKNFHQSYKWAAGYRYEDSTILGFSHTHFSGTGHSDLGDVRLMPIAGDVRPDPGEADKPGSGYRSRFSHDTEQAQPGYYAVTLADYGIRVELTATRRVGLQRYTFPATTPAHVLLEINISGDAAKHGFQSDEIEPLLSQFATLKNIDVVGLMTMAGLDGGLDRARHDFAALRELSERLKPNCPPNIVLNELSMGMSGDYEVAIEEGATIVRVGSALFEGIEV